MDVNTGLYETLADGSGTGTSNQAPGRGVDGVLNYGTKLKKIFIGQFVLGLVVEVHEKLEAFSLLLDDVQFRT
jgi:hypothetical protein